MTPAIEVMPVGAPDALKVEPRRSAQVARVGHQRVPVECACEQCLAERDRLIRIGGVETVRLPHMFRRLDDERARLVIELVNVRLKPAVFRLLECEVEGVPELRGPQPDVAIGARDDIGLKDVGVLRADL